MKIYDNVDEAYNDILISVLEHGYEKVDRTGIGTYSLFGYHYVLDISRRFPLLTTKEVNWRAIIAENLWFLSGDPHIRRLQKWGFKFWDAWADEDGNLETAYGRYWRYFPTGFEIGHPAGEKKDRMGGFTHTHPDDTRVHGFDQIAWILRELRTNPNSRRMVLTAWHPQNATASRLPACHYSAVFNVQGDKLNCHLTQRSADVPIGVPFNIAGYAFLTHLMAREVGLEPGLFSHTMVDCHIYKNQIDGVEEQSAREYLFVNPELIIEGGVSMFDLTPDDVTVVGYKSHPAIKMPVAV